MLQYFGIEVENHRDNLERHTARLDSNMKIFPVLKEQETGERQDVNGERKIQISNATMCKM